MSVEDQFVAYGVAADDRREGEFEPDDIPEDAEGMERRFIASRGGQLTAAVLERAWAERDLAYTALEHPLTPKQVKAIRDFRILEVRCLTPKEQVGTNLATRALTWRPPQ